MQHVVIVFHECRRTPRARENIKSPAGGGDSLLDEWYAELFVVLDAESSQGFIAFLDIGVAAAREITTVNVCPCQLVAETEFFVEICIQDLALFFFRQNGKHFRGSVCRSAERKTARDPECIFRRKTRSRLQAGTDKHSQL